MFLEETFPAGCAVGWEASELPYKALFQQPPSEARLQDFPARALSSELEV